MLQRCMASRLKLRQQRFRRMHLRQIPLMKHIWQEWQEQQRRPLRKHWRHKVYLHKIYSRLFRKKAEKIRRVLLVSWQERSSVFPAVAQKENSVVKVTEEADRLEAYVDELAMENGRLRQEYERGYDLRQVESMARGMGLIPLEEASRVSVWVPMETQEQESGFWHTLTDLFG